MENPKLYISVDNLNTVVKGFKSRNRSNLRKSVLTTKNGIKQTFYIKQDNNGTDK